MGVSLEQGRESMKIVIHKVEIPEFGVNEISLPSGARVLSVHEQNDKCMMWYTFEPNFISPWSGEIMPPDKRYFVKEPTGHEFEDSIGCLRFIGTVLFQGGNYVHHVFERISVWP
jgi:hypothetical protein